MVCPALISLQPPNTNHLPLTPRPLRALLPAQYRVNSNRRFYASSSSNYETRSLQVVSTCGLEDPIVVSPTTGMLSNQPKDEWTQMSGLEHTIILDKTMMVLMRYQVALRSHYTDYGSEYWMYMRIRIGDEVVKQTRSMVGSTHHFGNVGQHIAKLDPGSCVHTTAAQSTGRPAGRHTRAPRPPRTRAQAARAAASSRTSRPAAFAWSPWRSVRLAVCVNALRI